MKYKLCIIIFFLGNAFISYSQVNLKIKIIPEAAVKVGSQKPSAGIQACLNAGALFNDTWYAGIGGGFTSDLGLGGKTNPLYFDGRIFFSATKFIQILGFEQNDAIPMMFFLKLGISINKNEYYKNGYMLSAGLAYRWDVIKLNDKSILPFWSGIEFEYNRTKFYDEYRDYALMDGYLSQIYILFTLSFDIKAIQL
jgi:hypothetical protein